MFTVMHSSPLLVICKTWPRAGVIYIGYYTADSAAAALAALTLTMLMVGVVLILYSVNETSG